MGHIQTRLGVLLIAVLAGAGCPSPDGAGDDDTTAGDDGAEDCHEAVWDDVVVEVDQACLDDAAARTWDLQISTVYEVHESCQTVHAGRTRDVDGDGAITARDPMQLWLPIDLGGYVLVSHEGEVLAGPLPHEALTAGGTLADVDPTWAGMELLWGYHDDPYGLRLEHGSGMAWGITTQETPGVPWITDLEGDGALEVVAGPRVHDASTGQTRALLEGHPELSFSWSVAADLDLDGEREILTMNREPAPHEVRFHDAGGALEAVCWSTPEAYAYPAWAVGDLDGDPHGEVVLATAWAVVTCDSDGTLLDEAALHADSPAMVGLGQLRPSSSPEIVVADSLGLYALDVNLDELWAYHQPFGEWGYTHHPFALADLDADGLHEVVVRMGEVLAILDGNGAEVATLVGPSTCSGWISAPAVVDVDADGLAEIVVPGWPGFAIVENPNGGWLVDGAEEPWPGINKFPGDRDVTGAIPAPTAVPWQDPRTNVWQGLPAAPEQGLHWGELSGTIEDVCADAVGGVVTAYVHNHAATATPADLVVTLRMYPEEVLLGQQIVPAGLPAGVGRAVPFVVGEGGLDRGFELIVDDGGAIPECDEDNNTAIWIP